MLSILIPTYNLNTLLLVKTLQRQALKSNISFEIVVLDDASSDPQSSIENRKYFEELVLRRRIPSDDDSFSDSDGDEKKFIESAGSDLYSYLKADYGWMETSKKVKGSEGVLRSKKYALINLLDRFVR